MVQLKTSAKLWITSSSLIKCVMQSIIPGVAFGNNFPHWAPFKNSPTPIETVWHVHSVLTTNTWVLKCFNWQQVLNFKYQHQVCDAIDYSRSGLRQPFSPSEPFKNSPTPTETVWHVHSVLTAHMCVLNWFNWKQVKNFKYHHQASSSVWCNQLFQDWPSATIFPIWTF